MWAQRQILMALRASINEIASDADPQKEGEKSCLRFSHALKNTQLRRTGYKSADEAFLGILLRNKRCIQVQLLNGVGCVGLFFFCCVW